jgi:methionyl-tRNA formyltransferase
MSARAVVFAYHDVGDRCLRALISGGLDVPLVVTHRADPSEQPWFASVAQTAADYAIPVLVPEDSSANGLERVVAQIRPDFLFSFYYRSMIDESLLAQARRGAFNMHGSLLPKYRGRAPVNWAILHGEHETGATLHYMVARADAGDIVDQLAVPILQDDDAQEVMRKVTVAAEVVLVRALPALLAGNASRRPQVLAAGQYFGRRRPEDGRIDWLRPAAQVHNLVRAVAPPFPGAFSDVGGERWWIHRTRLVPRMVLAAGSPRMFGENGRCYAVCGDGAVLQLLAGATQAGPLDLASLAQRLSCKPLVLR